MASKHPTIPLPTKNSVKVLAKPASTADITSALGATPPCSLPTRRDEIALAFADGDIAFRVLDRNKFRTAFGSCIPKGFDRLQLASQTKELRAQIVLKMLAMLCEGCLPFVGWRYAATPSYD